MASSYWMKFFTAAGLPSKVASKYAITFTDHRIQQDMLGDLTKDMLYDMGIKTMGDVIAILRHAREVEENARMESLGSDNTTTNSSKIVKTNITSIKPQPQPKRIVAPPESSIVNGRITNFPKSRSERFSDSTSMDTSPSESVSTKVTFPSGGSSLFSQALSTVRESAKQSVFSRLDEKMGEASTTRRKLSITSRLGPPVKGFQNKGSSSQWIVANNVRSLPPIKKTGMKASLKKTISLKKSIFDRLGRVSL